MERNEIIKEIIELASDFKNSIYQRGGEISKIYQNYADQLFASQMNSVQFNEWAETTSLSVENLGKVLEYMSSSTFVSAWYHLSGNKKKRDKAAYSCSSLISALGIDPEKVMLKYIELERFWRKTMKQEKVVPRNYKKLIFFFLIIAAILLYLSSL